MCTSNVCRDTPARRERQEVIEWESKIAGIKRYQEARQSGEAETRPGQFQTRLAIPALAEAIERFIAESDTGKAGRKHTALKYLVHIEPRPAAALTIRHCLDNAAVGKKVNTVGLVIGTAIQEHIELMWLAEQAPPLVRKVAEQLAKTQNARHKRAVWAKVVKKYAADTLPWSDKDRLSLGLKLIELFEQTSSIIRLVRHSEGGNDTPIQVRFTPEAEEWFTKAHDKAAEWEPIHQPMVHSPRPYAFCTALKRGEPVTDITGGYLTVAMKSAHMIASWDRSWLATADRAKMQPVLDAVNVVQSVPWTVNRRVLEVMDEAHRSGVAYEDLFVQADMPEPIRPAGLPDKDVDIADMTIDQLELLKSWKQSAARVHDENARLASKRIGIFKAIAQARKFEDEESIYFPHYVDFRGRIYPYAPYLNPQSSDHGRALLQFAEGKPLGDRGLYWLKVHIANLFGIDKASFDDRIKWVNSNIEKLRLFAKQPLDCLPFWKTADSKSRWCALAACIELDAALVSGSSYVSYLPIAMDGSCSGLQHYSAMLRDPVGGAQVNLVPQEKPGDIYTAVAKRAQALVDASTSDDILCWKGGKVVRKIAKQPTMTLCYSATVFGMRGQIEKALQELGGAEYLGGVDPRIGALHMASVIWEAIGQVVIAAKDAMAFLQACAGLAAKAGKPIWWTAPSGFHAQQGYMEEISDVVNVFYNGTRVQLTLVRHGEKINPRKQASGVAPNFVHSCDSSHLLGAVNEGTKRGLTNWACIHDSFGVHACDTDELHKVLRETFVTQYTPDVLNRFRDEIAQQLADRPDLLSQLPAVPPKGTLELTDILKSKYCFA